MATNPDPRFVEKRQGPHRLASANKSIVRQFTRSSRNGKCKSRGHRWLYLRKDQNKICQRCHAVKRISNFEAALAAIRPR